MFQKLSLGHVRSHIKFGPDRFSRFDVYWIQTNRQAKFISRCGSKYLPEPEELGSIYFYTYIRGVGVYYIYLNQGSGNYGIWIFFFQEVYPK